MTPPPASGTALVPGPASSMVAPLKPRDAPELASVVVVPLDTVSDRGVPVGPSVTLSVPSADTTVHCGWLS